jgi:hypothetical protein
MVFTVLIDIVMCPFSHILVAIDTSCYVLVQDVSIRIWIDAAKISHVAHVSKGFGQMKTWDEWESIPREKRPKQMFWSYSSKSYVPVHIENYLRTKGNLEELNIINYLTTLSIQYWLMKR